ncbi:uncharacterized protein TNCV_1503461 [Trichonephila clavipes]|uniref:Uncharacterized protein n=1 Tax=Trichonephila clavipes TaxID=2585209 RepID=A0A8X6RR55_TRICX|nr:uncharacterized protein TNCV_1503461 [Trichonephila clavipes]
MPVLRETGASLDIGFEKCAAPEMFTEQNGLPRPEIGNEMQTRRERRKETEKSIRLENEKDQFRLRGSVVEIGEDFVPSLTGEGTNNENLVKLSACEIMEAQLRSEESAPLIRGTENGASDEASDQEGAFMQLIPVRHEVSTELYIDAIGPLPIVPLLETNIFHLTCVCHRGVMRQCLKRHPHPLWRRCYRFLEERSFLKRFKQMKVPYS